MLTSEALKRYAIETCNVDKLGIANIERFKDAPKDLSPLAIMPRAKSVIVFFIAEMGDKTQLATVALAARFDVLAAVVLGTTLGMLIANVPAVLVGEALAQKLPMKAIRYTAAGVFIATGLVTMFGMPGIAQ